MATDTAANWAYRGEALAEWFDELSASGVFMTDTDLRIRAWNRWLEVHTGRRAADVLGLLLLEVVPELTARGLDQYYRDALAGEARVIAQRFHGYLLPIPARETDRVNGFMPQSARIAPLHSGGRIVGTITVVENVTERVNSERELRNQIVQLERARGTAEAAVRTKDEFLATLSHELRTPLNAVLGWTRLMRSGQLDAATLRKALDVVDRNATAQAQLIDDMLDVARIMQGKLRIEMQPTDLVPVVNAAVDVIRPSADAKRLTLSTRFDADEALVTGDPSRLQQVVWNLLSNAVKFTDAPGAIEVSLRTEGDAAVVTVKDNGKGIAPEFLPFVFDRFRQEDSTTTRKYGGLGLGLSLVRQLVELHGGRVSAESAGEHEGSAFTFAVPLRARVTSTADEAQSDGAARDAAVAGRLILLIDDEIDARELLSVALTSHGARVVAVASAEEAYATMTGQGQRPDLIVADIGMPGEDGYTLLTRVRALPPDMGGKVPAIAVTGYAGPADRERALNCGFQIHFAKPVDPDELASAVSRLLADRAPTAR